MRKALYKIKKITQNDINYLLITLTEGVSGDSFTLKIGEDQSIDKSFEYNFMESYMVWSSIESTSRMPWSNSLVRELHNEIGFFKAKQLSKDQNSNSSGHGLHVGIERVEDEFFLFLKAKGTLTHEDYELITPMIDSALKEVKHPKVRALFDATEFNGWEPRAIWDDFKIALNHGQEFHKIAIYNIQNWRNIAEPVSKLAAWFMSTEIEFFDNYDDSIEWLNKD